MQLKMASTTSKAAQGFLDFVNASPTPFHAVANAAKRLEDVGFVRPPSPPFPPSFPSTDSQPSRRQTKISESDSWGPLLQVGKGYYFTRNQSALCAFVLPKGFKSGDGIGLVGTHVDSCCLKVRPVSKKIKGDFLRECIFLLSVVLGALGGLWEGSDGEGRKEREADLRSLGFRLAEVACGEWNSSQQFL